MTRLSFLVSRYCRGTGTAALSEEFLTTRAAGKNCLALELKKWLAARNFDCLETKIFFDVGRSFPYSLGDEALILSDGAKDFHNRLETEIV